MSTKADQQGGRETYGEFRGPVRLEWHDDGRLMMLLEPVCFVEPDGVEWPVPKGTTTDGASIPKFLWSILGGPFDQKYRKAALVHDWYCDIRTRPWQKVHRMFFNCMMASDVDQVLAKVMYYGVYIGGPRWNKQTEQNAAVAFLSTAQAPPDALTTAIAKGPTIKIRIQSSSRRLFYPEKDAMGDYIDHSDRDYVDVRNDAYFDAVSQIGALSLEEIESLAEANRKEA